MFNIPEKTEVVPCCAFRVISYYWESMDCPHKTTHTTGTAHHLSWVQFQKMCAGLWRVSALLSTSTIVLFCFLFCGLPERLAVTGIPVLIAT